MADLYLHSAPAKGTVPYKGKNRVIHSDNTVTYITETTTNMSSQMLKDILKDADWIKILKDYKEGNSERPGVTLITSSFPELVHKQDLLYRMTASLNDLALVVKEVGAYVVSNLFANNAVIKALTSVDLKAFSPPPPYDTWCDANKHEPLVLFHSHLAKTVPLILITQQPMVEVIKKYRSSFPTTLVLVLHEDTEEAEYIPGMKFEPKLLRTIADLLHHTDEKKNEIVAENRYKQAPTLSVVCSPNSLALAQMAEHASRNLPLLVLEGSGRYADIWSNLWLKRGSMAFDPVAIREQLELFSVYEVGPVSAGSVCTILREGDLDIYKMPKTTKEADQEKSDSLEDFVRWRLTGDKLVGEAYEDIDLYKDTRSSCRWKRGILLFLATVLSLAATVMAFYLNHDDGLSAQHLILIILTVIHGIVDSTENYLNSAAATAACQRAIGLVKKEMYFYCTRTLHFSDSSVDADPTGDSHMAVRERIFREALNNIRATVDATGVVLMKSSSNNRRTPFRGKLSGSDYINKRVGDGLIRVRSKQKNNRIVGIGITILRYSAFAAGTVLATLELDRPAAIAVAVTVTISRIITVMHIEEQRKSFGMAATNLEKYRVWWESWSSKERYQQSRMDELVSSVEQALEDTLPGTSGSHK